MLWPAEQFLLVGGYFTQYYYLAPLVFSTLEGQNPCFALLSYLSAGICQVAQATLFCIVYIWEILTHTLHAIDVYDKHWLENQGTSWYSFFNFLV